MAGLDVVTRMVEGAEQTDTVIKICPNNTEGEIMELAGLLIQLPKKPNSEDILFSKMPTKDQYWRHIELPKELMSIKSMDEWYETPREFQSKFRPYIELEFERRKNGVWFMNNGVPTYITGHHYMFLQWSKIDIGYPTYLEFQRRLFIHYEACKVDPRCMGQVYVKCRRSGYTNMASSILIDEGTRVKDKLLGIMSKTGTDAQEAVFMSKVIPIFRSYPFFFKPIQDGTTNPRVELAFREPAKRITKANKTSSRGEALDTIINWKNTTNNAYDGSKTHVLFLDECFAPGTKIMMSDMSFKNIEDIKVGEFVTVDGGKVVEVAKTFSGFDNMYRVSQNQGVDYVVSSKHRLILNNYHQGEIIITPEEYLSKSECYKRHTTRITAKAIELPTADLPLDPYTLGLWLGDGFSSGSGFVLNTDTDYEIIEHLDRYAKNNNGKLKISDVSNSKVAKRVYFDFNSDGTNKHSGIKNVFRKSLNDLGLINNKHIPEVYM